VPKGHLASIKLSPKTVPTELPLAALTQILVPTAACGLQPSADDFRDERAEEQRHRTKEQRGWRKVIRNFTPS